MPPKLPPHVKRVRNPSGRDYYYLTRHRGTARQEKSIRLPEDPRAPAFWQAYASAMNSAAAPRPRDSVGDLIEAWQRSPEWQALSVGTQREWRRHTARIALAWGQLPVRGIEPKHVLALRDQWASMPATANNMIRCLSSMLSWSVPRDWRADNPCREVKKLRGGDAYAPWPWEIIHAARDDLIGRNRADLWWVLALALYTGQRLGDCLAMRWSAINQAGLIAVTQQKTGKHLLVPLHRDLRAVLDVVPRRAVTILTTNDGTPWRAFHSAWSKNRPRVVSDAGLVLHGLRKSAVVFLLEAGCTVPETAAITGQGHRMVEHYAQRVNQSKLAAAAVLKWENANGT